jgi:hypothetical protein
VLAQQKTEPQPDRYLRIPAVGGVAFVGHPRVEIGSRPARTMARWFICPWREPPWVPVAENLSNVHSVGNKTRADPDEAC